MNSDRRNALAHASRIRRSNALMIYVLLMVALQVFLLVVAVEGILGDEANLARTSAALSVGAFATVLVLWWFLRDD